jgi:hypothetical protein
VVVVLWVEVPGIHLWVEVPGIHFHYQNNAQ